MGLLGGMLCQAQSPFIHSLEVSYVNAIFDPFQGLSVKANHAWSVTEKRVFQSSLSLAGMVRPGSSPATTGTTDETYTGLRLQFNTGWERNFGEKAQWYGILEGFVGLRGYLISGSLDQPSQDFNREYASTTIRGDFGLRTGLGYRLNANVGLQLTLNASLIDAANSLGPWVGILFWGPDVLSLVGVGVNYRF